MSHSWVYFEYAIAANIFASTDTLANVKTSTNWVRSLSPRLHVFRARSRETLELNLFHDEVAWSKEHFKHHRLAGSGGQLHLYNYKI